MVRGDRCGAHVVKAKPAKKQPAKISKTKGGQHPQVCCNTRNSQQKIKDCSLVIVKHQEVETEDDFYNQDDCSISFQCDSVVGNPPNNSHNKSFLGSPETVPLAGLSKTRSGSKTFILEQSSTQPSSNSGSTNKNQKQPQVYATTFTVDASLSTRAKKSQLQQYQHYTNQFQPHLTSPHQLSNSLVNSSWNYSKHYTSSMRKPAEYTSFMEVPTLHPTEQEFKDPFMYFFQLYQLGYSKHGMVKIVPPKSWKPEYSFDKVKDKLTTRVQVLSDLSKAKPFVQNSEQYTYNEFKARAEEVKKQFKFKTRGAADLQGNLLRKNEYEFWERVEHPELFLDENGQDEEEFEVEYAADLPSKKYGSAFNQQGAQQFHLDTINAAHNSLFQNIGTNGLSGITSPWVYLGMFFASFCWHVEDLYMCALNYLHLGAPKTWYGIPPSHKSQFEKIYKDTFPEIFSKKPDVLFHLNLMFSPAAAAQKGIPVYRTDQLPGEFIFTFPQTYHAGFSHGFNCGEAVNVISFDWFDHYHKAVKDYAELKHPIKKYYKSASFAIEWLITNVIFNLQQSTFDLQPLLFIKDEYLRLVKEEKAKRQRSIEKYQGITVIEFQNKLERYDRHICWQCGYYPYFSYLYCLNCQKKMCLHHDSICSCNKTAHNMTQLLIRFNAHDLEEHLNKLNAKIKEVSRK